MAKKDVFQEDKFGVRFFIYNRKKYFVVSDLSGGYNKHSKGAIARFLSKDPMLRIFGPGRDDVRPPKFCLSFAGYKVMNKKEIKKVIEEKSAMTLSTVSMEWLSYHKINVQVEERRVLHRVRATAEELYCKVLKYRINSATNHITENRKIV